MKCCQLNRFFYWLTVWLSYYLMPSDKHNSITTRAMGSISSLFNIVSSRDVPFCQPLQLQYLHHGSTKAYLCSPFSWFLSPLPHRWRYVVAPLHGFVEDLVIVLIAEVFNSLSFYLKRSLKCFTTLKMKHNCPFAFSLWLIDPGGARCHKWIFSISIWQQEEVHFMLSFVYNAVLRGEHAQIQSLLAYELFVN